MLEEPEKRVLLKLSLFQETFTSERAMQIAGATLPVLRSLVNHSLLMPANAGRFILHALLRQYLRTKLAQRSEMEQAALKHYSETYLAAMVDWMPVLRSPRFVEALTAIDQEYSDIIASWEWAVNHNELEQILQTDDTLFLYHYWRCRFEDYEKLYQQVINTLAKGRTLACTLMWLTMSTWYARSLIELRKLPQAWEMLELIEPRFSGDNISDKEVLKERALFLLAKAEYHFWKSPSHSELFDVEAKQAVELAYTTEDTWLIAQVLATRPINSGHVMDMAEFALKARELKETREHPLLRKVNNQNLAFYGMLTGQHEMASRCIAELEPILGKMDTYREREQLFMLKSLAAYHSGQWAKAKELFTSWIQFKREHGDPKDTDRVELFIDWCDTNQGIVTPFLEKVKAERKKYECSPDPYVPYSMGLILMAVGNYEEAEAWLRRSLDQMLQVNRIDNLASFYMELGLHARRTGRKDEEDRLLFKALESTAEYGCIITVGNSLALLALNLGDAGRLEEMIALQACVLHTSIFENCKLYYDLYHKEIDQMAAGVPDAVREAAQARGRKMSPRLAAQEYLYTLYGIDKRLGDWPVIKL